MKGYLRNAPQDKQVITILGFPGKTRTRAFLPGTNGWPHFLHRYLFSAVGIRTFVLIEIFRASST